jgi:NADH-quinone oxidoreductase subunit I
MEQPPHPMRLGVDEQDYYVQAPAHARDAEVPDAVEEQVK